MTHDLEFVTQLATTANNPTINSIARSNADGRLILRPAFQRNLVWNDDQRSYLVDSILRNLPVPEVYLQTTTDADGREELIVVDGQQRISACLSFLNDDLRLVGDDLDPRWRHRLFSELEEPLQARFRGYRLLVRELPDVGDVVLREIFRRLNRTVEALEPQELRHAAYTGPYIGFIEFAASQQVLQTLGVFSARDYRRRRNDELVAEIAYATAVGAFPNKKEGLEESFLNYERHGLPPTLLADLARRFGRTFTQLDLIAPDLRQTRFRNKSDFYSFFVLLAREAELLPLDEPTSRKLVGRLRKLTDAVADLKRLEAAPPTDDVSRRVDKTVAKYTRAVERAASDRLNRIRRDEALRAWLGSILAKGHPKALDSEDEAWLRGETELQPDEYESDNDIDQARQHFQAVLLRPADN